MAWPVPKIEWAPGEAPTSTNPSWVDVSTCLRSGRLGMGRSNELDRFAAGTASLTLDNRSRTFDPSTQGDLLGSPVRISAVTPAGSTVRLFRGHVTSLPQSWTASAKGDAVVTLDAVDGMDLLEQAPVQTPWSDYVDGVAASTTLRLWLPLGEASGSTRAADVANNPDGPFDATINGSPQAGSGIVPSATGTALSYPSTDTSAIVLSPSNSAGSLTVPLGDSSGGTLYSSTKSFTVSFWMQPQGTTSGGVFFVSAVTGAPTPYAAVIRARRGYVEAVMTSTVGPAALVVSSGHSTAPHHVVVQFHRKNLRLYVDGVKRSTAALANDRLRWNSGSKAYSDFLFREPGGGARLRDCAIQHFMVWRHASSAVALSSADVAALYTAGSTLAWAGDTADERITRLLDQVNWPSSRRSLDVGVTALGNALGSVAGDSALEHAHKVGTDAEGGRFFIDGSGNAVLHNRHRPFTSTRSLTARFTVDDVAASTHPEWSDLELRYTVDDVVNYATVTPESGVTQTAKSTASIDTYGTRRAELSAPIAYDEEASDRAAWLVQSRKDPAVRVESVTVNLGQSSAAPAKVLGLQIGDRINVTRTPSTGAAITIPAYVEGRTVDFDVQRAGAWSVTLNLASLSTGAEYLTLDSTTRGILDTNRVGY